MLERLKYIKQTMSICCLMFVLFYLLSEGCASRSVEFSRKPFLSEEVKKCIENLGEQSFEFENKLEKPRMKGKFKGITNKGDAKVDGFWEFDGKREKVKIVGIGEKEYKWENKKWNKGARTNLSNPMATLKLVCSVEEWKFEKLKGETYIYSFNPNLFFMDPRLTETKGLIWINAKSRIIEKIVAEAGTSVKWEFEVKSIDKKYEIENPLARKREITLTVNADITVVSIKSMAEILKERFELYGFNQVGYKLRKRNIIILSFSAQNVSDTLIEALLETGNFELYQANYVNSSKEAEYFVCEDPTKPIVLKTKLKQKLVNASFDNGIIDFVFDKELPEGESIAVMVDNKAIGFIPEIWGEKIKVEGDKETWIKIKLPLSCQPTIIKRR